RGSLPPRLLSFTMLSPGIPGAPALDGVLSTREFRCIRSQDFDFLDHIRAYLLGHSCNELRAQEAQLSGPGGRSRTNGKDAVLKRLRRAVLRDFGASDFRPPADHATIRNVLIPAS